MGSWCGDVEVVGDEDEGGVGFRCKGADEFEGLLGVFGVEGAGGFVGEDELGAVGEGAGDGDALLLADGQFSGFVGDAVVQADAFEEVVGPLFVGVAAGEGHSHEDVFHGGEAGEEVVGLEDVADVLAAEVVAVGFGELGEVGGFVVDGVDRWSRGRGRGFRRGGGGRWFCRSRRSRGGRVAVRRRVGSLGDVDDGGGRGVGDGEGFGEVIGWSMRLERRWRVDVAGFRF